MITMGVEEYTKDAWGGLDEERPGARSDAESIRAAVFAEFPEGRSFSRLARADRRTADVRENQPPHTAPFGFAADRQGVHMPADAARERDAALPARGLGEEDVRVVHPLGELPELGRPRGCRVTGADPVAVGRMARMDHVVSLDREVALRVRAGLGLEPACAGQSSNRGAELGPLVGHQPGVQSSGGNRAGAAVDHDTDPGVLDQKAGGSVPGRAHRAYAESRQPEGRHAARVNRGPAGGIP